MSAFVGLLLSRRFVDRATFTMLLTITLTCSFMLMGAFLVLTYVRPGSSCWELWVSRMQALAFTNLALCAVGFITPFLRRKLPAPVPLPRPQLVAAKVSVHSEQDLAKRVASLTLQTYTVETGSSETDLCGQCVICLSDAYEPGDTVRELHCHHTYHSDCFYEWIHKGGQGCPMRCEPPPISGQTDDPVAEMV